MTLKNNEKLKNIKKDIANTIDFEDYDLDKMACLACGLMFSGWVILDKEEYQAFFNIMNGVGTEKEKKMMVNVLYEYVTE